MNKAVKIVVKGIVQGVGFRPFIYRLANNLSLSGTVFNSSVGVVIEVEGDELCIDEFLKKILLDAPPISNIDNIEVTSIPIDARIGFKINESLSQEGKFIPIAPDISICEYCLQELFSPTNHRFKYPFINCTNCGPRFTIIKDIPYDRKKTTMHKFRMCNVCKNEYLDQSNRRYHAQPNACKICGPQVKLLKNDASEVECDEPIKKTTNLLKQGKIVAIKGIGGFHLACDAENDAAVYKLRKRKKREEDKPFAIMLFDVESVRRYCEVNEQEEALLTSPQRPIVLLRKLPNCTISKYVAPKNNHLGVMLPYTPLHYLLFNSLSSTRYSLLCLVMTSGNFSNEPLTKDNDEAIKRLGKIADYLLVHNRDIHISCDDSVSNVVAQKESIIRRSRGYAPLPIKLKFKLPQILATGAELKNTFCLTRDNYAFISQHIGDLKNYETLQYYKKSIEHFKKLFRIEPEIIAHDLHPDYLSTKFAKEYYALHSTFYSILPIQHHHAHIVSCMAENGVNEPVIGVALDGIGYGTDGKIWGGEFMIVDYKSFKRIGHLKYIPMPGGDMATIEPYRMAISYLYMVFGRKFMNLELNFNKRWKKEQVNILIDMIDKNINSTQTSSYGRLFDAVSSILGICDKVNYEAQAAIELEMIASTDVDKKYKYEIISNENMLIIDPSNIIQEIIKDMLNNISVNIISAKFHNTLIEIINEMCIRLKNYFKIDKVALSGGVFQNRYLTEGVIRKLTNYGFICYHHSKVPTNDGGISLGQAVIASTER
jgi:hydrogenase maturation protein HypF